MRSGAIDPSALNDFRAAGLPLRAGDAGVPRIADHHVDFGAFALGAPVAHGNQATKIHRREQRGSLRKRARSRAAYCKARIQKEQHGSFTRFGPPAECEARGNRGPRVLRHRVTEFGERADEPEWIVAADLQKAVQGGVHVGGK